MRRTAPAKVKIERGVPLPPARMGRPSRWPLAEMKPGDSFHADDESARKCAHSFNARAGKLLFAVRREGDGWRIFRLNGKG